MKTARVEKALHVDTAGQVPKAAGYDRIYYGPEFCQNLLPDVSGLERVLRAIRGEGKPFTFVTPFVTQEGLDRLVPLFSLLSRRGDCEVVVGDWGVFRLLRRDFPRLEPVIGRLLINQQNDPRAGDFLAGRQTPAKVYDESTGRNIIYMQAGIPGTVVSSFQDSSLNTPVFQDYLLRNAVRRVEISRLLWDMRIDVDRRLGVTLHLPYGYVSTTRLCGLLNFTYRACGRECRTHFIRINNRYSPVPIYIKGNAVYYPAEAPNAKQLKRWRVDRIVVQADPIRVRR